MYSVCEAVGFHSRISFEDSFPKAEVSPVVSLISQPCMHAIPRLDTPMSMSNLMNDSLPLMIV